MIIVQYKEGLSVFMLNIKRQKVDIILICFAAPDIFKEAPEVLERIPVIGHSGSNKTVEQSAAMRAAWGSSE